MKPPVGKKIPKCAKCDQPQHVNPGGRTSGYCLVHRTEHQQALYSIKQEYDYDIVLESQGGVCAICKKPPIEDGRKFHFDHDHITGRFRGLLCHDCNLGLGFFHDNPMFLQEAALYLIEPNGLLRYLAGRFLPKT